PKRFSHILSCADSPDNLPEEVNHLRVNIEPNPMGETKADFQAAVEFIGLGLAEGGDIAVHCEMGTSRSPAVVAAYLIYAQNIELIHAVKHVYESRHGVQINPWILNDLKRWAQERLSSRETLR
ncbi:MAG: dual specificity protein phosphatase, partial [Limnobacter sp.]|nr:dual specificity protein phosphatase [Limnobacter sp.]